MNIEKGIIDIEKLTINIKKMNNEYWIEKMNTNKPFMHIERITSNFQ